MDGLDIREVAQHDLREKLGLSLIHIFLEQAGRKCVVLEADRIGSGQTKNTTAKVTSQHGLNYGELMRTVGRDMAQQYADANREAIERYRILIRKYGIECEWETCGAYLYGTEKERELREEYRAAVELGISARMIDHPEKTELDVYKRQM